MALGLPLVQLYDLSRNVEEQENLHAKYPEVVHRLISLLEYYVKKARSTPGTPQKNDVEVDIWEPLKLRKEKNEITKMQHPSIGKPAKIANQAKIKYSSDGIKVVTDGIRATSLNFT